MAEPALPLKIVTPRRILLAGALVVVASTLYITWREHVAAVRAADL